ncbi:MAG: LysR substrate-binding domain-containing protein [Bacteroidota bacterium]
MTITQLEYVIAVDTYRSFGEAAKHCFVTQPTLSMQIKKLEEELDVLIFDRSKKPVLTTDIGKKIVEQARITVLEAKRIEEVINDQKDAITGQLRVGIIPTLSPYLLPLFITKFVQKYPDVNIVIEELLTDQIIEKLNNDLIDVGVLVSPLNENSIVEIPIFYEPFVAYMSDGHPLQRKELITFQDLKRNEMWLLKEGHCFRSQVERICTDEESESRQLKFESGSLETLIRIVETQYGYTLLPELATWDLSSERSAYTKRFQEPQPVREVSLAIHRSFLKRRLIELFKQEILTNLPQNFKQKDNNTLVQWR